MGFISITGAKDKRMKKLFVLAVAGLIVSNLPAQDHQHHSTDTTKHSAEQTGTMQDAMPLMSHAYSLNLPMSRNGSGTAWLPDESPMYMYLKANPKSSWMIHGNVVLRYNNQDIFN